MNDLTLFTVPPTLTARQQAVYDTLRDHAGGLDAAEAGLVLHAHKHSRLDPCRWCDQDGTGVLKALRKKGLARYSRKVGAWLPVGHSTTESANETPPDFAAGETGTYGALPENY